MKPKLEKIKVGSRDEWLQERRKSLGGSDAAAIIGANKFTSPYMVWVDKMGELPDKEPNEAMRQGTDLEDYVAKRFCQETGKRVRRRNEIIRNPKYPYAHANVDRWIIGENAGLECKTTSQLNLKNFDDGMFPDNYYFQCLHYMAVTGADKYYLAVLVYSKDFLIFEIERNQELIDQLMENEKEFWEYVENQTPPPVDGLPTTDDALTLHYNKPESEDLTLTCGSTISDYMALKDKRKELDQEIKLKEQEIKDQLGNTELGHTDNFKVSWKKQSRKTFDNKRFMKDHDEMDFTDYFKVSESRVFRITERH